MGLQKKGWSNDLSTNLRQKLRSFITAHVIFNVQYFFRGYPLFPNKFPETLCYMNLFADNNVQGSAAAYRKMGNGFVKSAVAFEDMDACEGYKKDTYLAPEITKKTKIMDLCPLKQVSSKRIVA